MKIVYCEKRSMSYIIASTKRQNDLSQINIYNLESNQPEATYNLNMDEFVVSIDGYYDEEKEKIVFVTATTNQKCNYYEY